MNPYNSRLWALRSALQRTLGRPVAFGFVVAATGFVFALAALAALTAWRAAPLEMPGWMQAEALVLVAGAEGDVDLAALRSALRASLQQSALAASIDFVARDVSLRELAQRKNLASVGLADLRPNPLPDSFHLHYAAGSAPEQVEASVAALRKLKNVESVEYQPELYRRSAALGQLGGRLALLAAGFLGAAVLIAVALAATFWLRADGEELRVLHLLGADPAAVIRPIAYAAGLSLLAAALLAWWIAVQAAAWLEPAFADLVQPYGLHWAPNPLPAWAAASLCVGAALMGSWLAALRLRISMRRRPTAVR
jgi:cell division protein FtsX